MFSADCLGFGNTSGGLFLKKALSPLFENHYLLVVLHVGDRTLWKFYIQLRLSLSRSCLLDCIVVISWMFSPSPIWKTLALGILVLWLLQSSAFLYSVSCWCRSFVMVVTFESGHLGFTYSLYLWAAFTPHLHRAAFFMKLTSTEISASSSKFSAEVKVS